MCRSLETHWSRAPPVYEARRLSTGPLTINGDLDKPEWRPAQWSAPFVDIRGPADAPAGARPPPGCRTRFKMLWDDEFLYVAALLEYDAGMPIVATFTERNSPIFHEDSDFEVFLDPASSCHHYKELELNPLNTVWNLMLDKPYADGGSEYSGRVAAPGKPRHYDVTRQRTATRTIRGGLNAVGRAAGLDGQKQARKQIGRAEGVDSLGLAPEENGAAAWAVELALSHAETVFGTGTCAPPRVGSAWRINFSRVERRGGVNWTWAAQRAWDAAGRRFRGVVDMHRPEAWGYVLFAGEGEAAGEGGDEREAKAAGRAAVAGEGEKEGGAVGEGGEAGAAGRAVCATGSGWVDSLWPARLAAACCYYAQRHYFEQHGRYATELFELRLEDQVVAPFHISMEPTRSATGAEAESGEGPQGFVVRVSAGPKLGGVSVRHDRLFGLDPPTAVD